MFYPIPLADNVFWIGTNDRRTHLFENLWPLEKGVSYNSYLIKGRHNVLIDTVEASGSDEFLDKISRVIGPEGKLDYLVINHLEPDHSGAIRPVIARYPEIRIVGNSKTFKILEQFYRVCDNLISIDESLTLDTGDRKLKFFLTPMLHWPETMMTYETGTKILFSGDAFGSFGTLDGGIFDDELNLSSYQDEIRRYYANIVGKYWNPVQKAAKSLEGTDIGIIAPTHGPVWRTNPGWILDQYLKWSRFEAETGVVIAYGSMYGHTEKMADYAGRILNEEGMRELRIYDASKTHLSYILSDLFLFRGVLMGSPAYNGGLYPPVEALISKVINTGIRNRLLGIFGSAAWGGGGVKALGQFAENIGWEMVGEPIQAKGAATEEDYSQCAAMARNMAKNLLEM
ncbi:MAG: FprA family A-type flavoprotein [Bacteroidales bacterium]|nr:FprA family A-type flavoprotein [Lentimicrobiaceae bacterium]MDD5695418.1 FprA family A-type flavoprotein [Bacteroidales bacterium]